MAYNSQHMPSTNYEEIGSTVWVIGGALVFDTSTATKLTTTGANVVLTGVPTADPHVAGALWANSNVLTLSAG